MASEKPSSEQVAALLDQIADLLEAGGDNPFRIQSYRDGASTIRETEAPVVEMADKEDLAGLKELPNIGEGLARVIIEFVGSGRSTLLADLQGEAAPGDLFRQVPGIGAELAKRIVSELKIDSLEALEQAAHDGRLEKVEGFGPRRLQNVRASLAGMLSRPALRRGSRTATGQTAKEAADRPSVKTLLEVDAGYRRRAAAGELERIAPKRFNPEGKAWLPIMHDERDGWRFTVLFSNTANAHELGKTDDWVVIYYKPVSGGAERQNTVVTETSGPLEGKRVVRGRAAETRRYYEASAGAT